MIPSANKTIYIYIYIQCTGARQHTYTISIYVYIHRDRERCIRIYIRMHMRMRITHTHTNTLTHTHVHTDMYAPLSIISYVCTSLYHIIRMHLSIISYVCTSLYHNIRMHLSLSPCTSLCHTHTHTLAHTHVHISDVLTYTQVLAKAEVEDVDAVGAMSAGDWGAVWWKFSKVSFLLKWLCGLTWRSRLRMSP
jgi:hypothetical protein